MGSLLYEALTYEIRGAMYAVHKALGPVHKESIYQKALAKEFKTRGIPFEKEVRLEVIYRGEKVGAYKPDFIVDDKVIVEVKAVEFLPAKFGSQLTYYLKGTGYKVGLLVNFGAKKLDIRRRVYEKEYRPEAQR